MFSERKLGTKTYDLNPIKSAALNYILIIKQPAGGDGADVKKQEDGGGILNTAEKTERWCLEEASGKQEGKHEESVKH